uniref:Uncharacterized protein n=1 Tax=Lepeophtheirus salmonis TaxID=72036 RepID=A0A0K2TSV9_LEPSM
MKQSSVLSENKVVLEIFSNTRFHFFIQKFEVNICVEPLLPLHKNGRETSPVLATVLKACLIEAETLSGCFCCDLAAVLLIHSDINCEFFLSEMRKTLPEFLLPLRKFTIFLSLSNRLSLFCS